MISEYHKNMPEIEFSREESNFITQELNLSKNKTPLQMKHLVDAFYQKFKKKFDFFTLSNHFKIRKQTFNERLENEITSLCNENDFVSSNKIFKLIFESD